MSSAPVLAWVAPSPVTPMAAKALDLTSSTTAVSGKQAPASSALAAMLALKITNTAISKMVMPIAKNGIIPSSVSAAPGTGPAWISRTLISYGGVMLAYYALSYSYSDNQGNSGGSLGNYGNTVGLSVFAGAKYYFAGNLGGFGELGFGANILSLGLSYKF